MKSSSGQSLRTESLSVSVCVSHPITTKHASIETVEAFD